MSCMNWTRLSRTQLSSLICLACPCPMLDLEKYCPPPPPPPSFDRKRESILAWLMNSTSVSRQQDMNAPTWLTMSEVLGLGCRFARLVETRILHRMTALCGSSQSVNGEVSLRPIDVWGSLCCGL
ncbi:hypothetical protein F4821DRAFT_171639 [Hypoxylon rubiginosum]|uniref:Uncharacterized protein n=1 Tax=Hypoxylon rubiginosum TaxID=110542 RepID=A0ACC0CVB5_9PEZI|nr:hypothetical protein F4821DRAFT_171639 [Hypoxylon rubiginosum]